jgi:hypothetical protein
MRLKSYRASLQQNSNDEVKWDEFQSKTKMKYLKNLLILTMIALTIFTSCKDDESPNKENEKFLAGETSKDWKITSVKGSTKNPLYSSISIDIFNNKLTILGNTFPTSAYDLPQFPECAKDNIITFKADKTYKVNEGATACTTAYEFELTEGTWAFTDNNEALKLTDKNGVVFTYVITQLTETVIEGENTGEFTYDGTNLDYTIKTTFSAVQ